MLHEFLAKERKNIIDTAKRKAVAARWGRLSSGIAEEGWNHFFDELTGLLMADPSQDGQTNRDRRSGEVGAEYLRLGYAITEVVQTYTLLYQAIMESATSVKLQITENELEKLSRSLDSAIADVVTQFETAQTKAQDLKEGVRIGFLAHELRNSLQSATIALELIDSGSVSMRGQTSGLLKSSLQRMAELIDTALTAVRLQIEPEPRLQRLRVFEVISEVEITAAFQARMRDLDLRIQLSNDLEVVVDRQLFVSALSNLVQNALKFTHPRGKIFVRARELGDRVIIEVEDECGGLPDGKVEELFASGVQAGTDRTGVGLGLAITRQALERNDGRLKVTNLPGKGCIFAIDLPRPSNEEVVTGAHAQRETAGMNI